MRDDVRSLAKRAGSGSRLVTTALTPPFLSSSAAFGLVLRDLLCLAWFPRCIPLSVALKSERDVPVQGGFAEVFSFGQTLHYTPRNPAQRWWGITSIYALL